MTNAEMPTVGWSAQLAAAGRLPARYGIPLDRDFRALCEEALAPGSVVLDVGSGRDPVFAHDELPEGCRYVGLDISAEELENAPDGAYDEVHVADAAIRQDSLIGRFDLIISWQVFEHIGDVDQAVENLRLYLKEGGQLIAFLSGKYSAFGVANQILPERVGHEVAHRILKIPSHDVFPARYRRCYASALQRLFSPWRSVEIRSMYRGAVYFRFFNPLLRAYVAYENWAGRKGRDNLATHYLIRAVR